MTFTIPNIESGPSFNGQSVLDSTDVGILAASSLKTGVVSGCVVSQDTGTDLKVAVSSGVVLIANVQYTVAATGGSPLTVTAASASDRRDLVVWGNPSASIPGLSVVAGTAAGTANYPVKPAVPANSVGLGEIYVSSSTTAITAANLIGKGIGVLGSSVITSGSTPALSTIMSHVAAGTTGTADQNTVGRDIRIVLSAQTTTTSANQGALQFSPDNVTYSTVWAFRTNSVLAGTLIIPLNITCPAGWWAQWNTFTDLTIFGTPSYY
jgi:hypothetical protein